MPDTPSGESFYSYFDFLERDYGFEVTRIDKEIFTQYIATSEKCRVMIAIPNNPEGSPFINIQPVGQVQKDLASQNCLTMSMDIARIAMYFDASMKQPEWWDSSVPRLSIDVQSAYMQKFCHRLLKGDFTEWPSIMNWLSQRNQERSDEFQKHYVKCGYEITEKDGKFGLTYNRIPVLPPIFSSVEVINRDSQEYTLEDYKDDPDVEEVSEYNFPIVIADGNYGLLHGSEWRLPLDYQKIIKLSYCHYLGQTSEDTYVIYNTEHFSSPMVTFILAEKPTMQKVMQILEITFPEAFNKIGKNIEKIGNDYISQYRCYGGCENINSYLHYFLIATIKVIIRDDFSISEPVGFIKP
jgi:hypothetical protein